MCIAIKAIVEKFQNILPEETELRVRNPQTCHFQLSNGHNN